jgi:hypothetical protein
LKKSALLYAVLVIAALGLVSCNKGAYGGGGAQITKPPSGLTERVLASQSASTPSASPGLIIVNGFNDTVGRGGISAGNSPTLMETSPERATLLAFDSATNKVEVVSTTKETLTGGIQLPGPTTSIAVPQSGVGYAAVPTAPLNGFSPGAVVEMNLTSGSVTATISVPNAQTVISNSSATQLLVFSNDSDAVTIVSPLLLNTGSPVTVSVPGFDRPVYGFFNGSNAYILYCGAECGGTQASVQQYNMVTNALVASLPLCTAGANPQCAGSEALVNGSTMYIAGTPMPAAPCTGQTTAALTCGLFSIVDLSTMTLTTSGIAITDGYHNRMALGANGQLYIGARDCTEIVPPVPTPPGTEIRGCLTIYNTLSTPVGGAAAGGVVIPPANGDVTGIEPISTRQVVYVVQGGSLDIYDDTIDALEYNPNNPNNPGKVNALIGNFIDVKTVDF